MDDPEEVSNVRSDGRSLPSVFSLFADWEGCQLCIAAKDFARLLGKSDRSACC